MAYVITPYVLISAFAAAVALVVAIVAWQRRSAPGGRPLVGLMLAVFIWSAGAAIEYATIGIPGKVFWGKVQYLGVVTCPVFFLLLALEYSHLDHWLTRRTIAALFVVPGITLLLAFTNEWHGLLWPTVTPVGAPADNLALYGHGIAFWIGSVGYSYLLMVIGTILLVRAAMHLSSIYRLQAGTLILAALMPWGINIIYVFGFSPTPGLELTPLVLAFTGAIVAWNILRLRLLDLAPIARETLIETMAEGMVVLDVQDRVVDINPAARSLLNVTGQSCVGWSMRELFATWPEWPACCRDLRTGQVELPLHDAAQRTCELTITPIHDRRGHYSGRLLVLHDITARKTAQVKIERLKDELEARVAARTAELASSEERFRQVITSISDSVFALRVAPDGAVTRLYTSPRVADLTGFTPDVADGDFFGFLELVVHSDDLAGVLAFLKRSLIVGAGELEYRWVRTDGAILWIRTSVRVRADGCDKIIFGVSSDISERRRMEQIDVEMRALAELDKLRAELVSNVSHELRTPLGLIKAASTTLQRRDVTFAPATQQKVLQGITDEADRLEHLVANLLDISRLDQNRFFLHIESVDLRLLVGTVVEAAQTNLGSAPPVTHRLVVRTPAQPALAMVDVAKIEQVLRNLLENAVRYSPDGGDIVIELVRNAEMWELRVSDQGIGIAAEEQSQIFERFYRSRDARVRRIRGAGLGLAICREIVRAHSGVLSLISALDQGATFVVSLPCTAPPTHDLALGDPAFVASEEELLLGHSASQNFGR
jgi:PAS domain S-box-containing protein